MNFDIIIVGGGMVGASLALSLRASPYRIALVDANATNLADDKRFIALNHSSYCLFENLKIWDSLAPHATAINEVHVSHRGSFGITRLTAREMNLAALGFVVPAKEINLALYNNLENITLLRPARLIDMSQTSEEAELTIETPEGTQKIRGKIIIGADGNYSTVRQLLNISEKKLDYQQSAIVSMIALNRSHHHIAYERFQDNGAIAMLPLTENRAAMIWTADNEEIHLLEKMSDDVFLQTLQKKFGYRLGRLKKNHGRALFPLVSIQAEQQIKGRTILIGNALHALHPIAAQGLNLALYEVSTLSDYLKKNSLDTFSLDNFAEAQQKIITRFSHHLNTLFTSDFFVLNAARQLGMIGLDLCRPLKLRFMRQLLGQTGRAIPIRERNNHETISA